MSDHSVTEAAQMLSVGRAWLYEKTASGEIGHQRYGRTIRFTDAQIEQIRQQFEQPAISARKLRTVGRAS